MKTLTISAIQNLPEQESVKFSELVNIYNFHSQKNKEKEKYYEGAVTLGDVNLGIALPDGLNNLQIGCE